MMVNVVLVCSKTVTFGLVNLEGASLRSLLSRRSRREHCLEAKSKILDRLLAERNVDDDCLPTYNQATRTDLLDIDESSTWTSTLLRECDAPSTMPAMTESNILMGKRLLREKERS
jgi:hypothetical protein